MRAFERLRQIGEQLRHLLGGLEVVIARDATAVVLRHHAALGDAEQRVVGLVVVGRGEVDLVGGDERDAELVGERDELRLDLLLEFEVVALQLDIEVAVEDPMQARRALAGEIRLAFAEGAAGGAERAAGENDEALAVRFKGVELDASARWDRAGGRPGSRA